MQAHDAKGVTLARSVVLAIKRPASRRRKEKGPDLIILLKEERATEWDTNHGRHYH